MNNMHEHYPEKHAHIHEETKLSHGTSKNSHNHIHSQGNIKIAFFLNLFFTIIEIIGGLATNSMAILSDALHDLGDSLSLGIAWYLEKYSTKKPDGKFSYGYARFSVLGALFNSFILFGGSILVLSKAIPRIFQPEPVNPQGMFAFAILGIIINGMAVLRLKRGSSLNERVVSWHLLEDVFGWVVILVSSIVLMFLDFPIIDPILSVFLTLYVLYNVVKNLKGILNVLLEGVPSDYVILEIEDKISQIPNVSSVHHTHIWSLEGEKNFLSTHVVIDSNITKNEIIHIKQKIRELLITLRIEHVTIEFDFDDEYCDNVTCD